MEEQINELKKNIKILHEGSTEDLHREIQTFDSILSDMEGEMGIVSLIIRHSSFSFNYTYETAF